MRGWLALSLLWSTLAQTGLGEVEVTTLVKGLKNPESVVVAPNGKIFVSAIGEFGKDGDGAIYVIEDGQAKVFAEGLDDPKGLAIHQKSLFVADKRRVWAIDWSGGNRAMLAPPNAFPKEPLFLNDIVADPESGMLYVSDSGDLKGKEGVVYRITPGGLVSVVVDTAKFPELNAPNGLVMDGASHLLLGDFGAGVLYRIKLADGSMEKLADGLGGMDGLAWDPYGRLFTSDWKDGRVFGIARPGAKPVLILKGMESSADLCYHPSMNRLIIPDMKAGTVVSIPAVVPGAEVDTSPAPVELAVAFPQLKWTGWNPETDAGKPNPIRPIVLTHANDNSNRVFVATEHGVIHVFPNDPAATETKVFADLQDRVQYDDRKNEEGFLGLAFHPKFKENGEFFVFYTPKKHANTNIVSRFRVRKDDPTQADPASEEELVRFTKPYWNHDGGTIAFGPDGFLYITHGDGGAGNDHYDNGQSVNTLLGKILRIDVDRKDAGKNYACPADNPFVGKENAMPEVWAYGIRNIWRMAFDRKTGQLWAGDVGQNLYEEINLIQKGGNYGWNRREALHPFGARGTGPRPEYIDPIWEYHHDVGRSITGGTVYRGANIPALQGAYLYADYVSLKMWALTYDGEQKRVVANRSIKDPGVPILSFGEDEKGEVYVLSVSLTGKGIHVFKPKK